MSKAVKQADPEAKIVLGAEISNGSSLSSRIKSVILGLNREKVFDVVDLHYWRSTNDWKLNSTQEMRSLLDSEGYTDVEIWSTEHGTYVNQPVSPPPQIPFQTESDQAASLIKRYVYNLANDVDKIFWNNLVEWSCFDEVCGGVFDNMGLISDGKNSGDTDTLNIPRLSYYTYKLMADKLNNSDWDNIQIISEDDLFFDVYLYKFINKQTNKKTLVAWSENPAPIQITIPNINSDQVKITSAIPNTNNGADLNPANYPHFFLSTTKPVINNQVTIIPTYFPIYIG